MADKSFVVLCTIIADAALYHKILFLKVDVQPGLPACLTSPKTGIGGYLYQHFGDKLLSAGECGEPKNNRMTNYTIAQSHNEAEWIAYIEEKDKPILNPDEYGKTVLDYAIMFRNYNFLKFLINKNYIWFDSRKDNDYVMTFGAGTNIQRIKFEERDNGVFIRKPDMDDLQYKHATEDQLRMHIISFAADHNDLSMLEKLRAREIPELYYKAHYLSCACPDFDAHYDKNMVSHIAKSSDEVLDYFTDPFEIRDQFLYKDGSNRKHIFVFPYISQLLDMLIENNSPFLKTASEKSIEHNENTREKLKALIKESVNNVMLCGCSVSTITPYKDNHVETLKNWSFQY